MFDRLFTLVDLLLAFTTGSCLTVLGIYFGLQARRRRSDSIPYQSQSCRHYEHVDEPALLLRGFALGVGECCTAELDGLQIISICDPDTRVSKVVLPLKTAVVLSRELLLVVNEHLRHHSGEEFNQQLSLARDHVVVAAELFQE